MKTFIGAKLYEKQAEIAESVVNSQEMYHTICCGRQTGKSYLCKQLLLYFAINNAKWQIMYVSLTYSQTNKLFKELLNAIKSSGIIRSFNRVENSIILVNGSEIYFKSYTNADAVRGYSLDVLIIDEAAFLADEDFFAAFKPTLAVRGKKCILCSSPRGYNWFKDMYDSGVRGDKGYKSYFANYKSCPYSNIEEVMDAKSKLPNKIFRAEYEGEFIEGGMSAFSNYENCVNIDLNYGKVVAGIDVGRQSDYTVLTIMNGKRVVYMERWRTDTWENIKNKIIAACKQYRPVYTYVEVNGIGDVFYEILQKGWREANLSGTLAPWVTTNQTKNNAVEQLIDDFNNRNISLSDKISEFKELMYELGNFEATYSKSNRCITYAARGQGKDDMVMSLAICNWNAKKNLLAGTYLIDVV